MTKKWLNAFVLWLGFGATVIAQEPETPEAEKHTESDEKAIELLGKADEKLYSLEGAGAKDVKIVISSPQLDEKLTEKLGALELKFVLLWKKGKEARMKVEGLPVQSAPTGEMLGQMMTTLAQLALRRPLVEKAKDHVVTMEKEGDLLKVIMMARDDDAGIPQEIVWFDSNHLPVKTQTTQLPVLGAPLTETREIEFREIDAGNGQKKYVMDSIKRVGEEGEDDQVIQLTYRESDNGFVVLERIESAEDGRTVQYDYDVTVDGGIPDSEFSG